MDEISFVDQLFNDLLSNDNDVISQTSRTVQELFRNEPNSFSQLMIIILQDYQNHSLEVVLFCFIFLRKIFYNATNVLQNKDERLSFQIIPQETADSYIPLILSFFGNENSQISYYSSLLLGQLAIYLLNFDSNHTIFFTLIEQIEEGKSISPSLESINFILSDDFQLYEENTTFQEEFMNKITTWFCDDNFPFESKPTLIKIIIIFLPYLSNILKTTEDNETFIQMMIAATKVSEFKFDSYEFWSNLSVEVPTLLSSSCSPLIELSITDLDERLSKYPNIEYDDERISLQILQFWINFVCAEQRDPESTSKTVETTIPSFLPFLLSNAVKFIDLNLISLDEDYSIFTEIISLISQISSFYPDISIPILIKFGLEAIESENMKEKVTGFYAINCAVFQFPGDDDEESISFCTQCINVSLSLIGTDFEFENHEMLRIVAQAIENVYNILYLYPNLIDYSSLIPRLVELMKSHIYCNCKTLILEIIKKENFDSSSISEIINALFDVQNYEAFNLIYEILKNQLVSTQDSDMKTLIGQTFPQTFSIISQIVERDSQDDEMNVLLNPLLSTVNLSISVNNEIISNDYQNFIQIIINCYDVFKNSEAMRIMAIASKIANDTEHMQYTIEQIIKQFDSREDDSLILSCLKTLIFDLESVDLSQFFGELMRSLLQLQEFTKIIKIKILILEAINSLHQSFPSLMQPYITRLIPLFGTAAVSFSKIYEQKENLVKELLKASLLFIQNAYQENGSNQENSEMDQCLQVAYNSIQCFLIYFDSSMEQYLLKEITLILFDLLNDLIQKNPVFAKKILLEDDLLHFIQLQSKEFSDSPFPSLSSIIQFLS